MCKYNVMVNTEWFGQCNEQEPTTPRLVSK